MRLSDPVTKIKNVGAARARMLQNMGIFTVEDILEFFPRRYEDRSEVKTIDELEENAENTFKAVIAKIPENVHVRKMVITRAELADETGHIMAVWYNQGYLKNALKMGEKYIFTGTVSRKYSRIEITSPEFEKLDSEILGAGRIVPVYALTKGMSQKVLRGMIKSTIENISEQLPEFLPKKIRMEYKLCDRNFAIMNIHFPESDDKFFIARHRLVFEELFLLQTALFKFKQNYNKPDVGLVFKKINNIIPVCEKALGFSFTNAQKKVISEIEKDVCCGNTMNRLVQGDVGSGKTAVAMAAALLAINSGYQAVIMTPTEVLASQHYESFKQFFDCFNIEVCLLSGSLKKKEKDLAIEKIASGQAKMIIGTHALIQKNVKFFNLGLVITDEQHRFGVRQRTLLSEKGNNPHIMVMTATPIPRTLAIILYGDLDISIIDELPPGRQKIDTRAVNSTYNHRIYTFIRKHLDAGHQAYIVCPIIEESDSIDAKAVMTLVDEIADTEFRDYSVGILHGKMKNDEKNKVMTEFAEGKIQVLVSTTVIEVGINVPNATIMLIENAERFGLSQLHQLRGRVGRGKDASYCILVTDSKGKVTRERMKIMQKTNDGFEIAETDLKLRGPGEFFGTMQHGLPQLKIANLYKDAQTLKESQSAARKLLKEDRELKKDENALLAERIVKMFSSVEKIGI